MWLQRWTRAAEWTAPSCGGEQIILAEGLRLRLTRNLGRDRGFVNGALGTSASSVRAAATCSSSTR